MGKVEKICKARKGINKVLNFLNEMKQLAANQKNRAQTDSKELKEKGSIFSQVSQTA